MHMKSWTQAQIFVEFLLNLDYFLVDTASHRSIVCFLFFFSNKATVGGLETLAAMSQTYEISKPETDEEENEATEIWLTGQGTISKALSALLQHAWLVVEFFLTLNIFIYLQTPLLFCTWNCRN